MSPPQLDVIPVPGPTSLDKAVGVVDAFPEIWTGSVLDVGCRERELERALEGRPIRYTGLDLEPPADMVANLEDGIPLHDSEIDVVVALDVLEHLDGIHAGYDELCRVAAEHVVIALPNCYDVAARLSHLRGRRISGKYGLPIDPVVDRHRWFFAFDDARAFCRHRAENAGWRVAREAVLLGHRRDALRAVVKARPNLFAPTLVVHLRPA